MKKKCLAIGHWLLSCLTLALTCVVLKGLFLLAVFSFVCSVARQKTRNLPIFLIFKASDKLVEIIWTYC